MDLIRLDTQPKEDEIPNDYREESFLVQKIEDSFPESSRLHVEFKRFGQGKLRQSDFRVEISWLDMQSYLEAFIEMEHPGAMELHRILKLAEAIEGAGWRSQGRPASDFLELGDY